MGWYKHWFGTPYYALLYGHRDEYEARAWVETILKRWDAPPGAAILDLACGRGRHARWLAQAGMKVTGIDISPESIQAARAAVPGAEFKVHDMREPLAREMFDGVCCLFTSLGYFEDLDDDRRVFHAAYQALRPGGRFVVDFMNSNVVLTRLVGEENLVREGVHFNVYRHYQDGAIVKRIDVRDGEKEFRFEEKVKALMPDQLEGFAADAGFTVEDRTDGPDDSPFDPFLSDRFVLWMKKELS